MDLKIGVFLQLVVLVGKVLILVEGGRRNRNEGEECALFYATAAGVFTSEEPAYINIGTVDIGRAFQVSMDIFVDLYCENGQLFVTANKDPFAFYEWPPEVGTKTTYIGMEVYYNALAMNSKPLGEMYIHQIEVYNTWPVPYNIHDGNWHNVKIIRDEYAYVFNVSIDGIQVSELITSKTDISITAGPAYIGGRPEYIDYQFTGAIKNLRVNGYPISLGDKPSAGDVVVVPCNSNDARTFLRELTEE